MTVTPPCVAARRTCICEFGRHRGREVHAVGLVDLLTQEEREQLAELNLIAGKRAKAATACA